MIPTASALLTDLYQLTMAAGYHALGLHDREAVFHLTFRRAPFGGAWAVACGLEAAMRFLSDFRFDPDDLAYLAGLRGNDGAPLFTPAFLRYLGGLKLTCSVDAMPEGTLALPREPLLRVRGPLLQCQLLETPLLNLVNFSTLIATKAARVCLAARGEPVLEFGLRRAQGVDGAMTASRAAYVGGCSATSNVLAGRRYGIPVRGTHAHSWVMAFDDELEAFRAYARAQPNNCIFLVDTYDTEQGVRNAVQAALELRREGHELVGIRLDSGDLVELSVLARRLLDEGGFPKARVVASSDLDEHAIEELKRKGAEVRVWGVGTRLVTGHEQPALGGVYKMSALRDEQGAWRYRIKLSEDPIKRSDPGILQVRRVFDGIGGPMRFDLLFDEEHPPKRGDLAVDPRTGESSPLHGDLVGEDLLVPVFRDGARCHDPVPLSELRERTLGELKRLPEDLRRLRPARSHPLLSHAWLAEATRALVSEAGGAP